MYKIGIDLGGTSIKAGLVSQSFEILLEKNTPTNISVGAENIIRRIAELADELVREAQIPEEQIQGIGIGSPGVIDRRRGVVLYSNNFYWENVPLLDILGTYTSRRAFIANDAQCAVLGELVAGAGVGCQDLVLLTLGTGVGSGIVVNGRIFEGGGGGGIYGHNIIVRNGEPCTCGRRGCAESYASATALIRRTRELVVSGKSPALAKLCSHDIQKVTGKTVFDAAKQSDPSSCALVKDYIEELGESIVNLINLFRPQKVLLSGGICNQGQYILEPLNKFVQENCYAGKYLPIAPVEIAKLGAKAGLVGAAALIHEVGSP
ncbi:MAG: ROK family protein [Eubacteriales bacterium]|nr:ROK family protein [Eubacteriales bacterium]